MRKPCRLRAYRNTSNTFPSDKMVSGMLDPEMIEDTAKIVNEAMKEKAR
jgi:hypothetical protein